VAVGKENNSFLNMPAPGQEIKWTLTINELWKQWIFPQKYFIMCIKKAHAWANIDYKSFLCIISSYP
jgi:hypothetical protein